MIFFTKLIFNDIVSNKKTIHFTDANDFQDTLIVQ